MLEKLGTYLEGAFDFVTPELRLHARIIEVFLEDATPQEVEELACLFANAYLEANPCSDGLPCAQD
jgi:hypothetical protein